MVSGVLDEEWNGSDLAQQWQNITRSLGTVLIFVSYHKKMGSSEFQKGLHRFFYFKRVNS